MNTNKPGENLTKGFLRRTWNYFTAKLYEKRLKRTTYFDKTWESFKWKIRLGKFTYVILIYYGAKYLFVNKLFSGITEKRESKRNYILNQINQINLTNNLSLEFNPIQENSKIGKNSINFIFEQLNNLNQGTFNIEEVDLNKNIHNITEKKTKFSNNLKKTNHFNNLTDQEKCEILIEIFNNICLISQDENIQNLFVNNLFSNNEKIEINKNNFSKFLIFYKVNPVLNKNELKQETEESKKFIS